MIPPVIPEARVTHENMRYGGDPGVVGEVPGVVGEDPGVAPGVVGEVPGVVGEVDPAAAGAGAARREISLAASS